MRKTLKQILLAALVLCLLLALCACNPDIVLPENEATIAIQQSVQTVLDSLLAEDAEACYAAFYDQIPREQFDLAFIQMRDSLVGVESYELNRIGHNYSNRNGTVTVSQRYWMIAGDRKFLVDAAAVEGCQGLVSFHITPEEKTAAHYTGTPDTMAEANGLQWGVLILGILTGVFVLWMAVDCLRVKPKHMGWWLVAILLGAIVLQLSLSGASFRFHFNLGVNVTLSSLIRYGDGSAKLNLVIPIGAATYLFERKRLILQKTEQKETADPHVGQGEQEETEDSSIRED